MKPKAVLFVAQDVQDEEYIYPYYRLKEDFDLTTVLSVHKNNLSPKGKYGIPIKYDTTTDSNQWYDSSQMPELIYIPGGWAPEIMRMDEKILDFIREAVKHDTVIAAICHGPQVLISADVIKDRIVTGYIGIKDDIINAGAIYKNLPVVSSKNIFTSPHYKYQPEFMAEICKYVLDIFEYCKTCKMQHK